MIPGQIRDLQLSEDCRQLDLGGGGSQQGTEVALLKHAARYARQEIGGEYQRVEPARAAVHQPGAVDGTDSGFAALGGLPAAGSGQLSAVPLLLLQRGRPAERGPGGALALA